MQTLGQETNKMCRIQRKRDLKEHRLPHLGWESAEEPIEHELTRSLNRVGALSITASSMPQSYKKSTAAWASWRRKGRRKDQHLGSSKLLECTALPPCLAQKQSDLPHWRRGPMCLCHTVHQQPSRCRRSSLRKGRKGGKGQQPYGWIGKAKETMPVKKEVADVALLSHTATWTVHSTSKPARGPDPHSWSLAAASNSSFPNGILLATF